MSFTRYRQIKQVLHFSNNGKYNPRDHTCPKLNKISPIVSHLVDMDKFQSVIVPKCDVSIDESLLLYKRRMSWMQFIPKKRACFGIESYMLCELKSRYVWKFIIYAENTSYFCVYKVVLT